MVAGMTYQINMLLPNEIEVRFTRTALVKVAFSLVAACVIGYQMFLSFANCAVWLQVVGVLIALHMFISQGLPFT